MSNSELAVSQQENPFVRASTALSQQLGLEPRALIDAIKTQFFKGREATDAQLAVVVSTARALGLNPLLPGQLYPYPDRSGAVTIMLGPDGIFTLLANNSDIVAQKDGGPAYWTEHGKDAEGKATCTGFINHRTKGLLKKTIWTEEWSVSSNPNWASRKMHMSEIRALKQAARMVVHGIPPDSDEQKLSEMYNVTSTAEENNSAETPPPERPAPKERAKRGAAGAKAAEVVVTQEEQKAATPPAEPAKPAENIQQAMEARQAKTEAAKVEPAKTEAKADAPTPRAFLQDGEKLTVIAKVETMEAVAGNVNGKRFPAIKALLSGGFNGDVRHKEGGARFIYAGDKETGIEALPPWKVGAVLSFNLIGQKSTSASLNGKVLVFVESVSAVGESASAVDQGEAME